MNAGIVSSQFCQAPPSPWISSSGGASPPVSITFSDDPATSRRRVNDAQSTSIQLESSPSAYVESGLERQSAFPVTPSSCSLKPGTSLP